MSKSGSRSQAGVEPFKGCIVDVDALLLGGIGHAYEVCERHMSKAGLPFDVGLFGRYLLGVHFESGVNRLLQAKGRGGGVEAAHAVRDEYLAALASSTLASDAPAVKLIQALSAQNIKLGLLTRLDGEKADAVLAPVLGCAHVTLLAEQQPALVGGFPWDAWRRAIQRLQMEDRLCVALVASAASCKAALAAGLPAVVVTNALTAHQDFSGASHVADGWSQNLTQALLGVLRIAR
jgi:beta-phosphoglucomutase-like phosphatase (HAD superfamily)